MDARLIPCPHPSVPDYSPVRQGLGVVAGMHGMSLLSGGMLALRAAGEEAAGAGEARRGPGPVPLHLSDSASGGRRLGLRLGAGRPSYPPTQAGRSLSSDPAVSPEGAEQRGAGRGGGRGPGLHGSGPLGRAGGDGLSARATLVLASKTSEPRPGPARPATPWHVALCLSTRPAVFVSRRLVPVR